jgi:carboxyl-terminal processing protease
MRRPIVLVGAALLLGGSFAVGYRASHSTAQPAPVAAPSIVDEVRHAIAAHYYRPVPERVLRLHSVRQIISALDDPYTAYLAPSDYRLLRQTTSSTYTGIGLNVLPSSGGYLVVSLSPGPAARAGVHVGDTIVRIGGTPAAGLAMNAAAARILGPAGTTVRLGLTRGARHLDVEVRRATIHAPAVRARLVAYHGHRYGEVRLATFRAGAAVVLARQLHRLEAQGAQGFVLDLRQNPGGLLDQAVAVSSLFLDRGVVVSLVGRDEPHEVLRATGGVATRLPLVVLVDRYSASSSEIVAAALRDHGRATVVGERTFGKALVQSVDPLDNGAALEYTIARYYTPAGEDISDVGVAPELHVVDNARTRTDEALTSALRVLERPAS